MSSTSAAATISEPTSAPDQAVEPADQRSGEGLQADHHQRPLQPGVARDQHAGHAAGEGGEPPGERVDAVQADAALRREQRVLAGGAHADAPARPAQEGEQRRHRRRRSPGPARAPPRRCARRRPMAMDALVQPSSCSGYCVCVPKTRTIAPRSRMPSAMVASTAASTDSPVMRHISSQVHERRPRCSARSAADADGAISGWPENSDAVAYSPYAPSIISSPCASDSTRLTR